MFKVIYRDGTTIGNLSYEESLDIFEEALDTENPCSIELEDTSYRAP